MNIHLHKKTESEHQRMQRRQFMKSVSGGMMGCGLADMLAMDTLAKGGRSAAKEDEPAAKRVLVIYEEGGISQMDSWDPKPEAMSDQRSPFPSIKTNVPGTHFSSLMPMIAKQADKLSVVRSMTSASVAGHRECCKEFFKGYRFNSAFEFPDIGSVVTEKLGTEREEMPGYIFCPGINMPNAISSTGFLPKSRAPWKLGTKNLGENVAAPGWKVESLQALPQLNSARFGERMNLLKALDGSQVADSVEGQAMQKHTENAFDLLTSPAAQAAFELSKESDKMRDRYGRDHRGSCYLLGRRLIESGVRFVTVTVIQPGEHVGRPDYGKPNGTFLNWDHHYGIYNNGPSGGPAKEAKQERYGLPHPVMMPSLDRSFSALIEDMDQRGLLDDTLVCFVTEMGRTPKINKYGGRDHWGKAMSVAFAGAGVPRGQVIGATDKEGGDVIESRYTPYDYAETIYRKLGINTQLGLTKLDGVAVSLSDGGRPIKELF